MAFLDNSGDIILDAVLTDTGRKRMADGNFSITQFGLGDDEINYGTYDLAHPSGSAYYDLEIMQTPVFEATTAINANINYGLLNLGRTDLLYIPAMDFNEKLENGTLPTAKRTSNMFFLAVNSETSEQLNSDVSGFSHLINQSSAGAVILIETGINNNELAATSANRTAYLQSLNMLDHSVTISADNRFINMVGQQGASSVFKNSATDNSPTISLPGTTYSAALASSNEYEQYNSYNVSTIANMIVDPDSGDGDIYSAISGPRGQVFGLNFSVIGELSTLAAGTTSRLFTDYGTTSATSAAAGVGGGSSPLYDFIDTTIFVQGNTSGASIQIPVRIIRYASTP